MDGVDGVDGGAARIDPDAPVRPARDRQSGIALAVAAGGVLGAEARMGLADAVPHAPGAFPWSTVLINVLGCLLIGALMVTITELTLPHRLVRPFLGVGVLGGFTTFSTFSVDSVRLIEADRPGIALAYVLCTVVAAACAVLVGTATARLVGSVVGPAAHTRASAHAAGIRSRDEESP